MSRPKGSKNKPKNITVPEEIKPLGEVKRGRGRPKGSTKKPKVAEPVKEFSIVGLNAKEIKRQIRALKKLKLQCRASTPERIELYRKIKVLKEQLAEVKKKTVHTAETVQDTNIYRKVYYTGYLSDTAIARFKTNFKIEFIKISNI